MSNSKHKIILFSETDYKGKALVVFGEIEDLYLQLNSWSDVAQSIIVVKGHWELKAGCKNGDPNEISVPFSEGGLYSHLQPSLHKGVSSLLPVWTSPPMPPEAQ